MHARHKIGYAAIWMPRTPRARGQGRSARPRSPHKDNVPGGTTSQTRFLIKNKQRVFNISQLLTLRSASCAH